VIFLEGAEPPAKTCSFLFMIRQMAATISDRFRLLLNYVGNCSSSKRSSVEVAIPGLTNTVSSNMAGDAP